MRDDAADAEPPDALAAVSPRPPCQSDSQSCPHGGPYPVAERHGARALLRTCTCARGRALDQRAEVEVGRRSTLRPSPAAACCRARRHVAGSPARSRDRATCALKRCGWCGGTRRRSSEPLGRAPAAASVRDRSRSCRRHWPNAASCILRRTVVASSPSPIPRLILAPSRTAPVHAHDRARWSRSQSTSTSR